MLMKNRLKATANPAMLIRRGRYQPAVARACR
jgi:hypothetical protein